MAFSKQKQPSETLKNQSPELQALAKAIIGAQGEAKASNETGSANNANNRQQQIQDLAQKLGDGNLNQANLGINKQAQDLAQKIGDGNRAQVNVNVTKEAESLVSQTSSSLSPNAALSGDAQSLPLRAQQAMTAANNPGGQAAALNNAAQNQQAANQSAQQAVNSIGAEAKAIGTPSPQMHQRKVAPPVAVKVQALQTLKAALRKHGKHNKAAKLNRPMPIAPTANAKRLWIKFRSISHVPLMLAWTRSTFNSSLNPSAKLMST